MNSNIALYLFITIGSVSVFSTIILALRVKQKRYYKYLPAIVTVVLKWTGLSRQFFYNV